VRTSPGLTPERLGRVLDLALTDEQLAAATAPLGPGLVVAGAGTGKTTVMAARVVWLVGTGQVAPSGVLGLTFTTKAAAELESRVRRALRAVLPPPPVAGPPGEEPGDDEPTVSTYHAYAWRLLRDHGMLVGLEPSSEILAEGMRYQAADAVLRAAGRAPAHLRQALRTHTGQLVELDAHLNEHLVEVADLVAANADVARRAAAALAASSGLGERDAWAKAVDTAAARVDLAALVPALRLAKARRGAVDFGDVLALAVRLAETVPDVADEQRSRYPVVLLDEYQDTSVAQKRLLAALFGAGHPVTAVGDPLQAIYGWRGASVANIDAFPTEFAAADATAAPVFALTQNNRSDTVILDAANALGTALREVHATAPLRPAPARPGGRLVVALHPTVDDELVWLAHQLRACVDAGTPCREVAVLARAHTTFGPLRDALVAVGLAVEVVGLGGLLALPEVADVVATAQLLADPAANTAAVRLLAGPRWRIGHRDLAVLGELARRQAPPRAQPGSLAQALHALAQPADPVEELSLLEVVEGLRGPAARAAGLSAQAVDRLAGFATEVAALRRHVHDPLVDLLARIVTTTGLDVELALAAGAHGRAGVDQLLDVAATFTRRGETGLRPFLAYLAAAQEYERGMDVALPTDADSVKVLTAHKAKGLEWDIVAVPHLVASAFPSTLGRSSWLTDPGELPAELRGDAASQPVLPSWDKAGRAAYAVAVRATARLEEDRLGYVAATRARHVLLASGHWWGPTQKKPRGPSPYLQTLHDLALGAGAGVARVDAWTPAPPDGSTNPLAQRALARRWPAVLDPDAFAARAAAAEAVRSALAHPPPARGGLTGAEAEQVTRWDRDVDLLLSEAALAGESVRDVALPVSLSASQLVTLAADPQRLAEELARPLPRPPAPAAARGSAFHAWVETLGGQRALIDRSELASAEGDDRHEDDEALATLRAAFLAGPYGDRVPVAVEAPFELVLAGRVIRGRIDAVYPGSGGFAYQVVDWKTGREAADPLQLAVYRLAWAQLVGVAVDGVDAVFYYVASGRLERPTLASPDALAGLLAPTAS